MDFVIALGLFGASLTTISLLPQLIKTFRTRSTKDLSLTMLAVLGLAFIIWLMYGILMMDIPLIVANSFAVVQDLILLILKIAYR
jgi:MtN3 and saliva related transmembrane protein